MGFCLLNNVAIGARLAIRELSLGLESEDFAELTQIVQRVAAQHANGRLVSVLEGGYNPAALAESVAIHLETLLDAG